MRDDDDDRVFHIRLNAKQRAIIGHLKEKFGASSRTSAIRACIEHMGRQIGLDLSTLGEKM